MTEKFITTLGPRPMHSPVSKKQSEMFCSKCQSRDNILGNHQKPLCKAPSSRIEALQHFDTNPKQNPFHAGGCIRKSELCNLARSQDCFSGSQHNIIINPNISGNFYFRDSPPILAVIPLSKVPW